MSTEDYSESENQELAANYLHLVENAIKKNSELIPSSSQNILAQVGNGFLEPYDIEVGKVLPTRVVGYQFPDQHKGYIVETGGVVSLENDDEALLPYVRHCYVVRATIDLLDENKKIKIVMHHGPKWKQIPLLIDAMRSQGDISNLTIIANSHFQSVEDSAMAVSKKIQEKSGVHIKGLDLNTDDARSLQILIKKSEGVLLTLPNDISQVDYDKVQYHQSQPFNL